MPRLKSNSHELVLLFQQSLLRGAYLIGSDAISRLGMKFENWGQQRRPSCARGPVPARVR